MPGKKNAPIEKAARLQPATAAGPIPQAGARLTPHLTVQERVKSGKEARARCPRSNHAAWDPPGIRLFLQLTEAEASVLEPYAGESKFADQNQRDYQTLVDAARSGRVKAQTGV